MGVVSQGQVRHVNVNADGWIAWTTITYVHCLVQNVHWHSSTRFSVASAIPVELAVLVPALLRNHGKHGLLLKSDLVLLLLLVLRSFSWWTAYIVLRPVAPRLAERELMVRPGLFVTPAALRLGMGIWSAM